MLCVQQTQEKCSLKNRHINRPTYPCRSYIVTSIHVESSFFLPRSITFFYILHPGILLKSIVFDNPIDNAITLYKAQFRPGQFAPKCRRSGYKKRSTDRATHHTQRTCDAAATRKIRYCCKSNPPPPVCQLAQHHCVGARHSSLFQTISFRLILDEQTVCACTTNFTNEYSQGRGPFLQDSSCRHRTEGRHALPLVPGPTQLTASIASAI